MLRFVRLEDTTIAKQFSTAQFLGVFAKLRFAHKLHLMLQLMGNRYPCTPPHRGTWPGSQAWQRRFLTSYTLLNQARTEQSAVVPTASYRASEKSLTLQNPSATCQDSVMESERRFWPQRLTTLGHNSISHKEPFWHVLFSLEQL